MHTPWIDRAGSVASAACAVHCGLLSLAPALAAVLGLEFLAHEAFEWGFFAVAVGFAAVAAIVGYRSHRRGWVAAGFVLGGLLLVAARLGEALSLFSGGEAVAIAGGVVLITFHAANTLPPLSHQEARCSRGA